VDGIGRYLFCTRVFHNVRASRRGVNKIARGANVELQRHQTPSTSSPDVALGCQSRRRPEMSEVHECQR
jgi:hypothetical protein